MEISSATCSFFVTDFPTRGWEKARGCIAVAT